MQAEDMKNAKQFLQQGLLTAAGIEKFDLWRDDIMRAARSVNLMEQAYWATINRFIETRMDDNIYQTVVDLILEGCREIEELDPKELLDQIEARLITSDQLEYKRLQFEIAKQEPNESLWEFKNCLQIQKWKRNNLQICNNEVTRNSMAMPPTPGLGADLCKLHGELHLGHVAPGSSPGTAVLSILLLAIYSKYIPKHHSKLV